MPRRPARRSKPRRKPARRGRKANLGRPLPALAGKGQYATCIETHDLGLMSSNTGYLNTVVLGSFPRAQQMASLFTWYKAAKVTWSYEPLFNTFQEDGAGVGKPYVLTMMNRSQELLSANYPSLLGAGARPVPFTNKYIVTYKPNWCVPGLPAITANFSTGDITNFRAVGLKPEYGWLATPKSPSTSGAEAIITPINDTGVAALGPVITNQVTYNGHASYIFQDGTGQRACARLICQVEWVFKGAKSNQSAPGVEVPPAQV